MQMVEELRKQEDIFKYAIELSDLEQAQTVQAASQLVQQLISHTDHETAELRRQQDMAMQQQVFLFLFSFVSNNIVRGRQRPYP